MSRIKLDDLFNKLKAPFPQDEVKFRVGQAGKNERGVWARILAYIDARAVMDRLDEVVGPENWQDTYVVFGNSTLCTISIRIDDVWVAKTDGAEQTDIEATKGGISDAFKRAAVKWGIFRYGYNLGDSYAVITTKDDKEAHHGKTKDGTEFWWKPKPLPKWALPAELPGNAGGDSKENPAPGNQGPSQAQPVSPPPGAGTEAKASAAKAPLSPEAATLITVVTDALGKAQNLSQLSKVWSTHVEAINRLGQSDKEYVIELKEARKNQLLGPKK